MRHAAQPAHGARKECTRAQGYFYAPTIIADAGIDMKIFREETFGPAVPLFKFGDDAEAVQLANDTEYGLASYFYTKVGRMAPPPQHHPGLPRCSRWRLLQPSAVGPHRQCVRCRLHD